MDGNGKTRPPDLHATGQWEEQFRTLAKAVEQWTFNNTHARARRVLEAKEKAEAVAYEKAAAAALDDVVHTLEKWLGAEWINALRLLSRRHKAIAAVSEALQEQLPDDDVRYTRTADGEGGCDLAEPHMEDLE